ncbi:hypothetical protein HOLDEFILI_02740 [Holdemania filiformis DSM 12042]|uniref:Uncharacterized protein n=1 Tax=Holdemania filiformis DSM 12042 TaxID=545696 RepID=B9YA83_9FIRM|nr:hypothetical protein HOLDEFILI_02740 [Holdemania filiformis DSM 12042]
MILELWISDKRRNGRSGKLPLLHSLSNTHSSSVFIHNSSMIIHTV